MLHLPVDYVHFTEHRQALTDDEASNVHAKICGYVTLVQVGGQEGKRYTDEEKMKKCQRGRNDSFSLLRLFIGDVRSSQDALFPLCLSHPFYLMQ